MSRRHEYYLRDGRAVDGYAEIDAAAKAARERGEDYQRVASTSIPEADSSVSTVYLHGMDHGWGDEPVLIFESMVFGGGLDQTQRRYSTEAQAVAGHNLLVQQVRSEAEAFRVLTANQQLVDAARLVRDALNEYAEDWDIEDYDASLYRRLLNASAQVTS